jgi:signal transduction histidine kinase
MPTQLHPIPTARPALIALAVVIALSVATTIGTLVVSRETVEQTRSIVDDTMTSVRLIGEMRGRVKRLTVAPAALHAEIKREIEDSAGQYERLVSPPERAEWTRLSGALERYLQAPNDAVDRGARLDQLVDSFDRLLEINTHEVQHQVTVIEDIQRSMIYFELAEGAIVIVVAAGVAALLTRVLRHQRQLTQRYLDVVLLRNRDLDAFASRTAHDLRGPLGPIVGYADLLAAGASVDTKYAAMKIQKAAMSMSSIINNLLTLSSTGDMPRGEVIVEPVVAALVAELDAELREAEVVTEIGDCKAACPADVLESVLRNLVTNASKYRSPERRLEIRIVAQCTGHWLELEVADNGIGMSSEDVARAFEAHFRADNTARVSGHGLGLSIVKRTLESIGGSVELTSELGHGTRVVMRLPRVS